MGFYYNKKAIKKKVAESDDPRLEEDEYSLLSGWAASVDIRYANMRKDGLTMLDDINRRNRLVIMSQQPELEDILETLTDELIPSLPDGKRFFAYPKINKLDLIDIVKEDLIEDLQKAIDEEYRRIYRMLSLSRGGAWKKMKDYLVWGKLAWEIVYDDLEDPKKITAIFPIDALTLRETWVDGVRYWIHEPKYGLQGSSTRTLHDSQVIMLTWDDDYGRISYLERLVRDFNIFRIMERTKINWYITNSMFRTLFVIPGAGRGRRGGAKTLAAAMNRYKDDIEFDDTYATIEVNGQATIPANKEYWLLDTDSGKPEINVVGGEGHDMGDTDQLSYFERRLNKRSRLPIDRIDPNSAESWNIDPTSQKRQEIKFSNFNDRIREKYSIMVMKPLIIQLLLRFPNLRKDYEVIDSITLEYFKLNVFDELAQMEIIEKKIEFIEKLSNSLTYTDESGRERKFWSREFLVTKWLGMTEDDLAANRKLKAKEDLIMRKKAKEALDEFGEDQQLEGTSY